MIKKLAFLLLGQLFFAQNFNFEKSLRIDFQLSGDKNNTQVFLTQMKEEPNYGGSKTNLIMPKYGNFQFRVIEPKTGEILFSKGFNSLYDEWLHGNNLEDKKLFYHAIQIPYPLKDMELNIIQRMSNGEEKKVYSRLISPKDYFIKKEKVREFPVKNILHNGDVSKKVDIAIIAEGYTKDEMDKFYTDVQRLTDYMFSVSPFDKYKKDFNIYAIGAISQESGTDIPGKNIYKNTIVNSSFYTFDVERYLTSNDMETIADIASLVPYDQIYVLVNTPEYGGSGFYNHFNLSSASNKLSPEVFVHEFGHSFVGLADEYYNSEVVFESLYDLKVEPWEPNITTLVDFDKKWKQMLNKKTPIPTPRIEKYQHTLGVFEGGGYAPKDIYSPMQDCRMKSIEAQHFCPVCSKAIEQTIEFYTK